MIQLLTTGSRGDYTVVGIVDGPEEDFGTLYAYFENTVLATKIGFGVIGNPFEKDHRDKVAKYQSDLAALRTEYGCKPDATFLDLFIVWLRLEKGFTIIEYEERNFETTI